MVILTEKCPQRFPISGKVNEQIDTSCQALIEHTRLPDQVVVGFNPGAGKDFSTEISVKFLSHICIDFKVQNKVVGGAVVVDACLRGGIGCTKDN